MNETDLAALWSQLGPDSRRRARIETRVFEWIEAGETSLAGEWFGWLKVEPIAGLALAAVGAMSLTVLTPVGWITALVLG
ncbi:MAG TPA: hypothetical protein PKE27_13990 [Povalibacter sp.]|uniref:hypothetical protein n=1 Tax=Povalibacter sp. TaxID=1962978 RepID=UPI002BC5B4D7|nr:hypothetical protein [Povalibacter sp.]HMN45687.1 hypothetical protein [Povalibacter sp.]